MTTTVSFGTSSFIYFRRSHSQASLVISRLHAGPTNTMTSSLKMAQLLASFLGGKTRRSTLPRARRRDPRYVIALIDPVAYDRQTVLAETAGAVVGVAERERHPAVGAGATHRLVAGQGAERYALVLGLRERATVMRGALLRSAIASHCLRSEQDPPPSSSPLHTHRGSVDRTQCASSRRSSHRHVASSHLASMASH